MSGDTPTRRELLDAAWDALDEAMAGPPVTAETWRDSVLACRARVEMLAAKPYVDALRRFAWLDASRETDRVIADFDAEYGEAVR